MAITNNIKLWDEDKAKESSDMDSVYENGFQPGTKILAEKINTALRNASVGSKVWFDVLKALDTTGSWTIDASVASSNVSTLVGNVQSTFTRIINNTINSNTTVSGLVTKLGTLVRDRIPMVNDNATGYDYVLPTSLLVGGAQDVKRTAAIGNTSTPVYVDSNNRGLKPCTGINVPSSYYTQSWSAAKTTAAYISNTTAKSHNFEVFSFALSKTHNCDIKVPSGIPSGYKVKGVVIPVFATGAAALPVSFSNKGVTETLYTYTHTGVSSLDTYNHILVIYDIYNVSDTQYMSGGQPTNQWGEAVNYQNGAVTLPEPFTPPSGELV